jgi:hypothetical protein
MNYPNLPNWQLVAVSSVVVILSVFFFSKYFLAAELISTNSELKKLQHDLQATLEQLDTETARSIVAEREAEIVRRANALLRASEREHQDEVAKLQAELAFYRRLGGASGSQAPLAVHYLELQTTQSPRVYRIIFTLTQNLRWAAAISGHINLGVDGISNGVAHHLTEEQLLAESAQPLKFRFKYFQQFERLITLPEGFAASRLTIHLRSRSLSTPVEQSMEWQSLFNRTSVENHAEKTPTSKQGD